jgi:predicted nucleic acid-binding protein
MILLDTNVIGEVMMRSQPNETAEKWLDRQAAAAEYGRLSVVRVAAGLGKWMG